MESGSFLSEHEFGTFRTSNKWKVDVLGELSVTNFLRYFGRSLRDHIAQSACDLVARRAYCVGGSLKIMCVRPCVRPYDDRRSHQK